MNQHENEIAWAAYDIYAASSLVLFAAAAACDNFSCASCYTSSLLTFADSLLVQVPLVPFAGSGAPHLVLAAGPVSFGAASLGTSGAALLPKFLDASHTAPEDCAADVDSKRTNKPPVYFAFCVHIHVITE